MGMGGGKGAPGRTTMSEINVTPMVDVMLVLLIIFMVTAPMLHQGVKVNLPDAKATPIESKDKKLVLTLTADKRVMIGEAEVPIDELEEKLKTNAKAQQDKEIYLDADKTLPYGLVVQVMAAAQNAGIDKLGMVTDPSQAPPPSKGKEGKK